MDIDFVIDGGGVRRRCRRSCCRAARSTRRGRIAVPNVRIRAPRRGDQPSAARRRSAASARRRALRARAAAGSRSLALGLRREELRRRNFLRKGDADRDRADRARRASTCERCSTALARLRLARQARALRLGERTPARREARHRLRVVLHGAGFTGSGEKTRVRRGSPQGTAAAGGPRAGARARRSARARTRCFAQIAADALGIARLAALIEIAQPDTAQRARQRPDGRARARAWWSASSSSARASPRARSCSRARAAASAPYTALTFRAACARVRRSDAGARAALTASTSSRPASRGTTRPTSGDAYGAYSWAVYVAQVAVDLDTYEARVERRSGAQEVGQVDPPAARRAARSRAAWRRAIGWALLRERRVEGRPHGQRPHDQLHRADARRRAAHPRRSSRRTRTRTARAGAKGIGELPIDGPAPAIVERDRRTRWASRSIAMPDYARDDLRRAGGRRGR